MEVIQQLLETGLAHHQAGRLQAAEQIYRQILTNNPDQPDTLHLLGVIAHQTGEYAAAVKQIQRAIRLNGTNAAYHNNLGNAFAAQQKFNDAIACFRRVLELNPADAGAQYNLGSAFKDSGNQDEAMACYRRAIERNPEHAEAHYHLGCLLQNQGRLEEAVVHLSHAVAIRPAIALAQNQLGMCLKDLGRDEEAIACYQRALQLQPGSPETYNNLGIALADQGQLDAAIACYEKALRLKPDLAVTHYNLGNTLKSQGKPEEAVTCFRRALELQPDCLPMLDQLIRSLQQLCLWDDLGPLMQQAICTVCEMNSDSVHDSIPPFAFLTMSAVTSSQQQHQCASRWVANVLKPVAGKSSIRNSERSTLPDTKIRLGYLSADFRSHPVGDLIVELLELHDRSRFQVTAYSIGPDDDSPVRQRIAGGVDRFVDLKDVSFADSARKIADDGIDILVDLMGYTQSARTQILANRPAPIQVNYLGYTGTMGASFIDYILVDEYVVPSDRQPFYSEKLVHLPGCYQVSDRKRSMSNRKPTRTECGLLDDAIVFCSFNHHHKITPEIFGVWMELLKDVPSSVLWLQQGDSITPRNLCREAEKHGVSATRLVFAPRLPELSDHLARYQVADLFLDTFPFNAHTTANDALWSGCPVLTLSGEPFVSRVAGSLLRTMGLPELITSNLQEYRELALSLAKSPDLLRDLRDRLRANRETSTLFDTPRFARNIENAFITMQTLQNQGKAPRPFEVLG